MQRLHDRAESFERPWWMDARAGKRRAQVLVPVVRVSAIRGQGLDVRVIRGRADAHWFPSRHNFALFRLAAYLCLRRAKPEHHEGILIIDRHQSATETWLVMSWMTLTFACYLAATLFADWHLALALPVSLPLAVVLLEVPAILSALTIAPLFHSIARARASSIRVTNGFRVNGVVIMLLFSAASAYFARHPSWIRFVAWQFLALLALNAIAAMIVFPLRHSIARLEAAVGGVSSAQ